MENSRRYWIDTMLKIVSPVIENACNGTLKENMPIEEQEGYARAECSHLEALGRCIAGIAPWLELDGLEGEEELLRCDLAEKTRSAIKLAVDPDSPSFLNFTNGYQPLVDAAFLAQGILRAKNQLWYALDESTKANLTAAMKSTRDRKPYYSNWLLFSATIEAFLFFAGEQYDPMRVDLSLRTFEKWYIGCGLYSDGDQFAVDYYNSYVINPMLVDIIDSLASEDGYWDRLSESIHSRARECSALLSRLIAADGSYPVLGRSSAYRFGAFHCLAQSALHGELPDFLPPAAARCAMTALIKRVMSYNNFDENGWLKIGVCGGQPEIGEGYISTGSLYLCSTIFLPLGLSPESSFWSDAECAWPAALMWRT